MKKLISLFLFLLPLVGFAQIPDANINTDINYVRTHGFDPPSTALPMQDLQNSKIGTIVLQATGTDTYVVSTFNTNISAYLSGTTFPVYFQNGNTGAATLKLGTLATKTLVKNTSTALASGDIVSGGRLHWVYYDGTNFRISLGGTSGGLIAANNLSDVASPSTSRTNLGVAIGTDVEAHDTDLTVIAGLSASNDDFIQRKAGAWANRTIAQVKTDLNLSGSNTGDQTISDATISTTDITTNNVSTSKHGFAPKGSGVATEFLNGNGGYSVPAGGFTNPMTTAGDIITGGSAGAATRLPMGTATQELRVNAGATAIEWFTPQFNPMTTLYDLIIGGAGGTPGRLGVGSTNQILSIGGSGPVWQTGLIGTTTNNSASSGFVGETGVSLLASGSATSLTTATAKNVTSVSLIAGDYIVWGNVNFTETTSTVTGRSAGITVTSATVPTDGTESYCGVQSTVTSETNTISLTPKRISLASTTTVYLVGSATFSAGTCAGFGSLNWQRIR